MRWKQEGSDGGSRRGSGRRVEEAGGEHGAGRDLSERRGENGARRTCELGCAPDLVAVAGQAEPDGDAPVEEVADGDEHHEAEDPEILIEVVLLLVEPLVVIGVAAASFVAEGK